MKRVTIIILFSFGNLLSLAQDPQFSQYLSAPLYLNPAFAGTSNDHRFIANYRNQWPNISRGFVTYAASYDANLQMYNSSVGFLATHDQAGTAGLKSTSFNFIYSYKWNLNDRWIISSGLNFGFAFRSIDMNRLVFGDQLLFDSDALAPSDDPTLFNLGSTSYFDFNSGILIYNRNIWVGFSASHLNRPNRSLLNGEAQLPIKTSLHGGARIPLYNGPMDKQTSVIAPSFVYKKQGRFDQLDLGFSFLYDPVVIGFWYRGIPIQQNISDNLSQDAVVIILGFNFPRFEVAYSYDVTISDLGPSSGGSHEIALKYKLQLIPKHRAKRPEKFVPCPTFMKQ